MDTFLRNRYYEMLEFIRSLGFDTQEMCDSEQYVTASKAWRFIGGFFQKIEMRHYWSLDGESVTTVARMVILNERGRALNTWPVAVWVTDKYTEPRTDTLSIADMLSWSKELI